MRRECESSDEEALRGKVGECEGSFSRERRRRTEKMRPAMADRSLLVCYCRSGFKEGLRRNWSHYVVLRFRLMGPVVKSLAR